MATIITRETGATAKGSPLTNTEVDNNFINLNSSKLELGQAQSLGTANGVLYLDGSKIVSSGTVLVLSSNSLGINTTPSTTLHVIGSTGILTRATSVQDGVALVGRAGGTLSYTSTITPTTLSASRTITLPDANIDFTAGLSAIHGGTGQSSYTVGDLLYASTTSSLSKLADVVVGNVLISGGVNVAPSWGKVGLTTHVSGTLPIANGGTGFTAFGTGVATWLQTPTSDNLRSVVIDETGSGSLVFATSPTLTTPILGVASATSINKVAFTAPATSATLTIADGKTFTVNNTIIINGTDSTTITLPGSSTTLAGIDTTQTLTNKRVTPRIGTIADAAIITATSDTVDQYNVTALAQAATVAAPSGTPTNGQKLVLRFKDNGTNRALTWTTGASGAFRAVGITLPTTTVATKTTYVGCIWNAADSRWDAIATVTEA